MTAQAVGDSGRRGAPKLRQRSPPKPLTVPLWLVARLTVRLLPLAKPSLHAWRGATMLSEVSPNPEPQCLL